MITYLKPREYYEDIYDKGTVEQCRFLHHHKLKVTDKDIEEANLTPEEKAKLEPVRELWVDVVQEMAAFFAAAERFNNKEAWIDKMMIEDKTKDHILTTAQPPNSSRCRKCLNKDLRIFSKDLWHDDKGKDSRVLFMFSCNDCNTKTAFYDDGEEWIIEPTRCPECKTEKITFKKETKDDILTITYTCERCDNVWLETMDFTKEPEEPVDPKYEEDRKLYCYSKKVRAWAEDLKNRPTLLTTKHSWEESETEKLYKEELEKIEMLTAPQVEKRLDKLLAKDGYKDFKLGTPDMAKELTVLFTVIDNKDGRTADQSKQAARKLINKDLATTNWRLIRTSLDYRVGYLKGKLRAYDSKYDLEKLIDEKLK